MEPCIRCGLKKESERNKKNQIDYERDILFNKLMFDLILQGLVS